MEEKFVYLKLGAGNCLAEYWLSENNIRKKPAAAIYFGRKTADEMRKVSIELKTKKISKERAGKELNTRDVNQIVEFIDAGENAKSQRTIFVTIAHNSVYIYEPENHVLDLTEDEYRQYDDDLTGLSRNRPELSKAITQWKAIHNGKIERTPKIMYVKIVKIASIKEDKVPHVLATLPCSQYYTRGTCREIKRREDWAAIQAIKYCLGRKQEIHPSKDAQQLMSLLSPYELETLVFLILRNACLHVSAWRGGTLKDIDIIARNLKEREIEVPPVTFKPKQNLTFQVKREVKKPSENADWTVAIYYGKKDKILTAEWLLEQVKKQRDTEDWLKNSLDWVPNIDSLISTIS